MTNIKSVYFSVAAFMVLFAGLMSLTACTGDNKNETSKNSSPQGISAPCALVTQAEAENLIGETLQSGKNDSPNPHVSSCSWSGENGVPKLMLHYHPSVKGSLASWVGADDTRKLVPLDGLSGEAVAVIQKGNPKYNIAPGLSLVAVRSGTSVITLSAPYLNAIEGNNSYNDIISLADTAAQRCTQK